MTVAALVTFTVPVARAGTPWDACPKVASFYGDHVTVQEPAYRTGPRSSSSLAADPSDVGRLAATNGREIVFSDDAGCTWSEAFSASRPAQFGQPTVVARHGSKLRVLVPVQQGVNATVRTTRLRLFARDGAAETATDLPVEMAAGNCSDEQRCFVRFAPGRDLRVAYAATPGVNGMLPRLATTTDGGRTWTVVAPPTVDNTAAAVTDLAIDPEDDAHVLVVAGERVHRSRDRGASWAEAAIPARLPRPARVVFTPTGAAVVADRSVYATTKDYDTFTRTGATVPGEPLRDATVAPTIEGRALLVAAGGALFREASGGRFETVLGGSAGVSQVQPTAGGAWVRRAGALGFVDAVPGRLADPTAPAPRQGGTRSPAPNLRGKAAGGRLSVPGPIEVPPGGSAVTVATGALGRQPRALDVFFLMDTTGSMLAKVQPMALAMGRVVESLNREGVAARFGLAEYGDRTFRYRRHADLGTPPAEVQAKLLALKGGGGDEFHYTAFHQLATGEGMPKVTTGGTVPPGLQASFLPGALHVVVHATDDVDQNDPDGPTEAKALAALNGADVRHIGIFPYDGVPGPTGWKAASTYSPAVALRRYAQGTSTFAPSGGVDCDGDELVDLAEGDPIACPVIASTAPNAPIGPLLERLLLSLATFQPVAVAAGPSPLEVDVRGLDDYSHVDLHEAHDGLEFEVQVRCPATAQATTVNLPLQLQVGGVTVASTPLPVACLAGPAEPASPRPPAEEPPTPRRAAARPFPGVPAAAASPPALAQSTATAQAQAQAQATSSANAAQVGMAVAPEDAAQLATEEEDDLHFVARTRPAPSPVGAAGVVFAVAVALLYAVRPSVAREGGRKPRW